MNLMAADPYRVRLEGRFELLETTRGNYRALLAAMRGLRWRERLRKNAALLRAVADGQREVESALRSASRRATAEAWPRKSTGARLLDEVRALHDELRAAAARRLRFDGDGEASLGELLQKLESTAVTGPRTILPGQRWATALEVLPPSLPELARVAEFGGFLERLFKRPFEPEGKLPFSADEARALRTRWELGEASLEAAYERLGRVDRSGGLVRHLQRKARRAPVRAPRNGPETLLHAAFWHTVARSRLEEVVRARLAPVEPTEAERWPVVAWLCAREADPSAPLQAPEVSGPRAALIELAHELWLGLRRPQVRRADFWQRLESLAARADGLNGDADAERVRDTLRLFLRIRGRRWKDGAEGLLALVEEARALSGA